jgi:type I restriction-modification system DNA methylase subunit
VLERVDTATGFVLLALRSLDPAGQWDFSLDATSQWRRTVKLAEAGDVDGLRQLVRTALPFADGLIDWHAWDGRATELSGVVKEIASLDKARIPKLVDALALRCALDGSAELQDVPRDFVVVPPAVRSLTAGLLDALSSDRHELGQSRATGYSIYQAGSGLGQAVVDAARADDGSTGDLFVQESSARTGQLARLNLAAHGLEATVRSGDVLQEDAFPQLRADRVIATPPWEPKISGLRDTAEDPRWLWGEPGVNDGYLAWIQHTLYHLADGGRAVILLPLNALFAREKSARTLRRVVKAGHVEGVVSLPAGARPGTSVRGVLIVLVKTPTPDDWFTTMVDMSLSPDGSSTSEGIPTPELIRHTVDIYREAAGGMPAEAFNWATVELEEMAANDFILDPGRYQYFSGPISGMEQMMTNFGGMRLTLQSMVKACQAADKNVATMLGIEL